MLICALRFSNRVGTRAVLPGLLLLFGFTALDYFNIFRCYLTWLTFLPHFQKPGLFLQINPCCSECSISSLGALLLAHYAKFISNYYVAIARVNRPSLLYLEVGRISGIFLICWLFFKLSQFLQFKSHFFFLFFSFFFFDFLAFDMINYYIRISTQCLTWTFVEIIINRIDSFFEDSITPPPPDPTWGCARTRKRRHFAPTESFGFRSTEALLRQTTVWRLIKLTEPRELNWTNQREWIIILVGPFGWIRVFYYSVRD